MANLLSRLWLNKIWRDQRGQDMTEYALLAGLMASAAIAVVPNMMSIAQHLVELLQAVAQTAINAGGIE